MQVHTSGKITFTECQLNCYTRISPLWSDGNVSGGEVYFRETNDTQLRRDFHDRLQKGVPSPLLIDFYPTTLVIATWVNVTRSNDVHLNGLV